MVDFERHDDHLSIGLVPDDLELLEMNGSLGVRDGVFGPDSKINIKTPRTPEERRRILRTLVEVAIDPDLDIYVTLDPTDLPINDFEHLTPREEILTTDNNPLITDCIPSGGIILGVKVSPNQYKQSGVVDRYDKNGPR